MKTSQTTAVTSTVEWLLKGSMTLNASCSHSMYLQSCTTHSNTDLTVFCCFYPELVLCYCLQLIYPEFKSLTGDKGCVCVPLSVLFQLDKRINKQRQDCEIRELKMNIFSQLL